MTGKDFRQTEFQRAKFGKICQRLLLDLHRGYSRAIEVWSVVMNWIPSVCALDSVLEL
jgi:hypothetical protein